MVVDPVTSTAKFIANSAKFFANTGILLAKTAWNLDKFAAGEMTSEEFREILKNARTDFTSDTEQNLADIDSNVFRLNTKKFNNTRYNINLFNYDPYVLIMFFMNLEIEKKEEVNSIEESEVKDFERENKDKINTFKSDLKDSLKRYIENDFTLKLEKIFNTKDMKLFEYLYKAVGKRQSERFRPERILNQKVAKQFFLELKSYSQKVERSQTSESIDKNKNTLMIRRNKSEIIYEEKRKSDYEINEMLRKFIQSISISVLLIDKDLYTKFSQEILNKKQEEIKKDLEEMSLSELDVLNYKKLEEFVGVIYFECHHFNPELEMINRIVKNEIYKQPDFVKPFEDFIDSKRILKNIDSITKKYKDNKANSAIFSKLKDGEKQLFNEKEEQKKIHSKQLQNINELFKYKKQLIYQQWSKGYCESLLELFKQNENLTKLKEIKKYSGVVLEKFNFKYMENKNVENSLEELKNFNIEDKQKEMSRIIDTAEKRIQNIEENIQNQADKIKQKQESLKSLKTKRKKERKK